MRIKLNKKSSSSSSEICFEERVEDKDESVELYETVSNNNDYTVEQKRECIESKLSGKVD